MRYRLVYFLISALLLGAGVYGLFKWGLVLGVDFKGGAILEYQLGKEVSTEEATKMIEGNQVSVSLVQKSAGNTLLLKTPPVTADEKERIFAALENLSGQKPVELRFENVGPSVGPDLVKRTFYALGIAASLILVWIAIQFRSFKFGISAILAMFHDSLVLIGGFSLLGHFFGAEVDFLFVTAALTILSFSVHDTIVVYDRIRESQKKIGGSLYELANKATTETMVRSLNNSFTIIFMLVALILLGGSSIKWFAIALLIGTISGTYSSPFVAVPILVSLDEFIKKIKKT
ncbi:MAG: protein translocase subunit SecF [Patescibacteria group bacterium]